MVERGTVSMGALTASSDPRWSSCGKAKAQKNTAVADNDTITLMELANEGEPRCLLYYQRGSFPRCIPNGLSTQYWSGYHAANPLQNYLSLARCRSATCPVLALPLGGCYMSSRDPLDRSPNHDLGASRDGVWEVFNDGLVNSMCVKKRQINLTALV